jgi:hypothetical protein
MVSWPTWVFVYTGPGTRRTTTVANSTDTAIVLHWNKEGTLFVPGSPVKPLLFRLGAMRSPRLAPLPPTKSEADANLLQLLLEASKKPGDK